MGALISNFGIEMTSLLADFLASLLDLKDRTYSIFRLGPGMLLCGFVWEQADKKLLIKPRVQWP